MAGGMGGGLSGNAPRQDATTLGRMAAGFLGREDGPRIAMIETSGWDTHSGQTARLATQLGNLDNLLAGLHEGLGAAWDKTVILVATEFGRTVAANGTGGTDHGTGAVAMMVGGAVRGGRIVSDWPGVSSANLLDGRDLKPTLALDTLVNEVCAQSFTMEPDRLSKVLFPHGGRGKPMPGLLRT